jgi:putative transposase
MVNSAGDYRWSSYTARMGGAGSDWLDLDPLYLGLGEGDESRRERYRAFLEGGIPVGETELIREAVRPQGQIYFPAFLCNILFIINCMR